MSTTALTYNAFIIAFPEFKTAPAELVNAKLVDALEFVDVTVWGSKYSVGHGLYAAHLLALSPFGQNARMVIPSMRIGRYEPVSTYLTQYQKVRSTVCSGFRVT